MTLDPHTSCLIDANLLSDAPYLIIDSKNLLTSVNTLAQAIEAVIFDFNQRLMP